MVKPKTFIKKTNRKYNTKKVKPSKALVQAVKTITMKDVERKMKVVNLYNVLRSQPDDANIYHVGLTTPDANAGGWQLNNVYEALGIVQGTTQQQRIGNEIQPTSLTLKGFVQTLPYQDQTNNSGYPYEVHILVWKYKPSAIPPQTGADAPDLLNTPTNTQVRPDGSVENSMYPWNRDQIIVKKYKVINMRPPPVDIGVNRPLQGVDVVVHNPQFNTATAKAYKRFSMKIATPKKLTYNDGDISNIPNNDWCCISAWIVNGNGILLPISQVRAQLNMTATLTYTDE